ncbi:hypothetical protein F5Y09DRAFT_137848 [Xylaria sp. FL1042]|nr:hypothetical protein F5Y09DRAFT_137848 [Xylaria sp. FL1042]
MTFEISDLSNSLVVRITDVLARRPEYGIARPSQRWFQRQEEKIKNLPKELLGPSALRRIAIKIADRIDPNIVDPRAVLCKTHSGLNPFLIRRLFIAVAYEVTVYTETLRSWQSKALDPGLSAMVGRLDSIVALWTPPELFHDIYGLTPFDPHHVFVKSGCEACCLAAVGASGRALADLRVVLIDRMERRAENRKGSSSRKVSSEKGSYWKEPRLYRFVEAWIDQLRKQGDSEDRAEQCRALSEPLLAQLRVARHQIKAWRAQQNGTSHRQTYAELKRTPSGAKIAPLPRHSRHHRRTRDGIPIAVVDVNGAEGLRKAANPPSEGRSIYRPDSISGYSHILERHRDPRPTDSRPPSPEPPQGDGLGEAGPTSSFLYRFEQELSIHDHDPPAEYGEGGGRGWAGSMEESRLKVEDWFKTRVTHSQLLANEDYAKTKLSMVHPAFRSMSTIAQSAMPPPLQLKKDREPKPGGEEASVWTDCSVYTVDDGSKAATNVPPVPKMPSKCKPSDRSSRHVPPFQHSSHRKSNSRSEVKPENENPEVPNWPAPPTYDSIAAGNPYAIAGPSEAYLKERFKPRYADPEDDPEDTLVPTPTQTPSSGWPASSVYSKQTPESPATSRSLKSSMSKYSGTGDRSYGATKRMHETGSRDKHNFSNSKSGSKDGQGPSYVPPSAQASTVATRWEDFMGKM